MSKEWTMKEMQFLKENIGVIGVEGVAKELGRSAKSVRSCAGNNKISTRHHRQFALYRGEEILAEGTVREIAEKMNVKQQTIRFYHTPSGSGRTKNGRVLVKISQGD